MPPWWQPPSPGRLAHGSRDPHMGIRVHAFAYHLGTALGSARARPPASLSEGLAGVKGVGSRLPRDQGALHQLVDTNDPQHTGCHFEENSLEVVILGMQDQHRPPPVLRVPEDGCLCLAKTGRGSVDEPPTSPGVLGRAFQGIRQVRSLYLPAPL